MALQVQLINCLSSSKSVCKIPFAKLANLTFEVGKFLEILKIANVVPIHKKAVKLTAITNFL